MAAKGSGPDVLFALMLRRGGGDRRHGCHLIVECTPLFSLFLTFDFFCVLSHPLSLCRDPVLTVATRAFPVVHALFPALEGGGGRASIDRRPGILDPYHVAQLSRAPRDCDLSQDISLVCSPFQHFQEIRCFDEHQLSGCVCCS